MTSVRFSRRSFLGTCALGALATRARGESGAPRKLGVALAGLGNYSRGELAPALRKTRLCKFAGVVTGDPEKGAKWADEHGFPATSVYGYDTMDRLADNKDIDIVYVVTPNGLHARHAIAAAEAGKHVICEKPMANTVAECDAMLAACRANDVQLSVGYRLHFDPYHEVLRGLARTGRFGPFTRSEGNFAFRIGGRAWRVDRELAGGGPLMDIGIYIIQSAFMASRSRAVAVTARELPKTKPDLFDQVEEAIEWELEFADGSRARGRCSYNDGANRFRAEAAGGWFEMDPSFSYRGLSGKTSEGPLRFEPEICQQALQMDDFARYILSGEPSPVSGEMGRRDMRVVEAIYQSAATGKRVEIPHDPADPIG